MSMTLRDSHGAGGRVGVHLSCSTLGFELETYPDIGDTLRRIRALGFTACDIAAFEDWQNVNPSSLVEDNSAWVNEVEEGLGATGLRVTSLNCGMSTQLDDPDPRAFAQYCREFEALADLAVRLRCPNLTVQPGHGAAGHGIAEHTETARKHLAHLGPLAQERGLTIGVEGHQGSLLEDPTHALQFIEEVWPVVGFTYDPSHWTMQDIPLAETAPLLRYTVHVHVRNAALGKMQATVAEGGVDFAWLIEALRHQRYSGAVAVEYFNGFDSSFSETLALAEHLRRLGVSG
jgi:sugar phosphate isomerase/epimerase